MWKGGNDVALFSYRFVYATQRIIGTNKVWVVQTADGKQDEAMGIDLFEYSNKLGQEAWELVSDSVNGTSRDLVFRHTTV
jgi:hypothetical protein